MNQCEKCGAKDREEDKSSELYAHHFFWHGDIEEDYDMGNYNCLCIKCFSKGDYWINKEKKS
jgi:hypothetical protein